MRKKHFFLVDRDIALSYIILYYPIYIYICECIYIVLIARAGLTYYTIAIVTMAL